MHGMQSGLPFRLRDAAADAAGSGVASSAFVAITAAPLVVSKLKDPLEVPASVERASGGGAYVQEKLLTDVRRSRLFSRRRCSALVGKGCFDEATRTRGSNEC